MSPVPYSREKALIIGAGIGGLSTAIILAGLGYDVTVVEQNRKPGGMMRSFVRQGVHCNVGIHYMGALAEGQILRRCFDYLGITEQLPLVRMGVDGPVDRYHFKNSDLDVDTFDLVEGFDAYTENLNRTFPAQKSQIQSLMRMLRQSAAHLDRLDFLYTSEPAAFWIENFDTLGAVFDDLGCSPGLRAVFGLPSVLIGVPPAVCPRFFHTMTLASYLLSSWRLKDCGAHMADVCAARLAALGGIVRTGRQVISIRSRSGQVTGVTLDSGEQIDAPVVIGAIHPKTILGLLDPDSVKASWRRRIQGLKETASMVGIHALVPADRYPAIPHNVFSVETDPDGGIADMIYLQLRPCERPEAHLLTLLTSGYESMWQPWLHTRRGQRGPDYLAAKERLARQIIADMEPLTGGSRNPEIQDPHIIDVFTPLSFRDWVAAPGGSAYGVMRSTDQMLSSAFLNRNFLKGFYLAGQNVMAPGVLGTILGSLATSRLIVGPERFRREVRIS